MQIKASVHLLWWVISVMMAQLGMGLLYFKLKSRQRKLEEKAQLFKLLRLGCPVQLLTRLSEP